ncbi:hypothetical protein N9H70_05090 [Pseudomonadales bacterium]|nr:hypothetical protein [Pseudomonadales bacterium]
MHRQYGQRLTVLCKEIRTEPKRDDGMLVLSLGVIVPRRGAEGFVSCVELLLY